MYSLRMSAWTVPESLLRSKPRDSASATYIAGPIHALGLMVMPTESVSYFARDSGCLRRKSASSFRSHSSRIAFGSVAMADALLVEIAIVDDPLRLELGARDHSFRHQLDARADAEARLQELADGPF